MVLIITSLFLLPGRCIFIVLLNVKLNGLVFMPSCISLEAKRLLFTPSMVTDHKSRVDSRLTFSETVDTSLTKSLAVVRYYL